MLFHNCGILYFIHNHLKHFFERVKDENKLLTAVHSDLQIKSYLGGCIVVEISKDDIYNSLILPSNILDESFKKCLEIIFGSLCIITSRMLDKHLEDGKHYNLIQQLMKKSISVTTTSSIKERYFGMLDRFIREKPNGNMKTYESIMSQ